MLKYILIYFKQKFPQFKLKKNLIIFAKDYGFVHSRRPRQFGGEHKFAQIFFSCPYATKSIGSFFRKELERQKFLSCRTEQSHPLLPCRNAFMPFSKSLKQKF